MIIKEGKEREKEREGRKQGKEGKKREEWWEGRNEREREYIGKE